MIKHVFTEHYYNLNQWMHSIFIKSQ